MQTSNAKAQWQGNLKEGKGHMAFGNGAFEGEFSFGTRFEGEQGTNPEQLLAAAHSGCFSMAFANMLAENDHEATSIETTAEVNLDPDSLSIPSIKLTTVGKVLGISESDFQEIAEKAKENCPVSKLFASAKIELDATLA